MTQVKELAIVKSIMAKLKLDDAGKIDSFFRREIKKFKRYIEELEANKKVYIIMALLAAAKVPGLAGKLAELAK